MFNFHRKFSLILAVFLIRIVTVQAQITITTETGTNFTGGNGVGGNSAITFSVENTNTFAIVLTDVDVYWQTANTGTTPSLWYSSISLSGPPTISSPDWNLVTGPLAAMTITANAYYPTFTGLNIIIPPSTTYRFAVQSSAGIRYSGASPVPSPTSLSASGVNLLVYDFQISGAIVGYGGAFPTPTNNPRAFTGRIKFIPAVACSGAPTAGNVVAADTTVCPATNINLGLLGATLATGLTYQWQSSPDSLAWTDIAAATQSQYIATQSGSTYYRCILTCNGLSDTTSGLRVIANTFVDCYCTSFPTSATGSDIGNVTVAGLNNGIAGAAINNPTSVNTYTDFSSLPATALVQGNSYPIVVTQINSATFSVNYATAHIDFNHDGQFDPVAETFDLGPSNSGTNGNIISSSITVPFTSLTGITRMRIVLRAAGTAAQSPCGTYGTGETEDYLVDIQAGTACVAPPTAGSAAASNTSGCSGLSTLISLTGNSIGTGQTFQWQSSPDSIAWTNISGATNNIYSTPITATLYYRCVLTCSNQSANSAGIKISLNPPSLCYCVTGLGGGGCASYTINDVVITGTSLNNLSNNCTGTTANTLTVYPASGNTTATLVQGLTYSLSVTLPVAAVVSVWFDWDGTGTYDQSEWTQVATVATSAPNVPNVISFTVPVNAISGQTGMRIRSRSTTPNGAPDACLNFGSGETEDYILTIIPNVACTGMPNAGSVLAADTTVCPSVNVNLSLQGSTLAGGLSYQWESSPDNINWTSIPGATSLSYSGLQSQNTYYHCLVTCTSNTATSTSLLVLTNTFIDCYCTSGPTSGTGSDIGNVTLATLNNGVAGAATNNPSATALYTDNTSVSAPSLTQGLTYPIQVTQINSAAFTVNYATAHIDFNHDGAFDPTTEVFDLGPSSSGTNGNIINSSIVIPFTALTGNTRMRIVLRAGGSAAQSPCGTYATGETEDYLVNIVAGTACIAPPNAGTTLATVNAACPGTASILSLAGNSIGTGQTFQWESSADSINWTPVSGATNNVLSITINATLYYRCVLTCSAQSATSLPIKIQKNPPSLCYCVTGLGGGGCASYTIDDVVIVGTTLNNISNNCTGPTTNTLTVYPPQGNTTASLIQGITYDLSVTMPIAGYASVWVDWNGSGVYEPSEWTQVCTTANSAAGVPNVIQLTVPFTSVLGQTGMRIRSRSTTPNGAPDACLNFGSGETEDYIITLVPNVACTGTPNPGTLVAPASICPNVPFTMTLSGSTLASGFSYQWQSSSDNVNWNNITGATSISYQTSITTATYFRCTVTCSSASANSNSGQVTVNGFVSCYCTSNATNATNYDIGNVTFGSLNNGVATPLLNNSSSTGTYSDFTTIPPHSYVKGSLYPLSITQINSGTFAACQVGVWIDFDHDGIFDPTGEIILAGTTVNGQNPLADTIEIPATALSGITRMRVVLRNGTIAAAPCSTYVYGETEDYLINILSPNSCSVPFTAGFARSTKPTVCADDVFFLSLDSLSSDTGYSFQWQHSFDNTLWNNIPGGNAQIISQSQNFDSYYRCNVTCNGGTTVTSAVVNVLNKAVVNCNYCSGFINGNCTQSNYIDSIAFGQTSFNNANTGCAANAGFAYSKYPPSGNTTTLLGAGNYYDLFVKTIGDCSVSVWIDYDQSGTFDANEWKEVATTTVSGVTKVVPFVVSDSAKLGVTGMRVRSRISGGSNSATEACSAFGSGETEDYFITIVSAISTGKELLNDRNFAVYPNPSKGQISLFYSQADTKKVSLRLCSIDGKELIQQEHELNSGQLNLQMDISRYNKGIYYVQVISGSKVVTKKIVLN